MLKKPVFEKANADWLSDLPFVMKQNINNIHSSTKLKTNQASMKKKDKIVISNLQDERQKQKSKYKLGDLVLTADI